MTSSTSPNSNDIFLLRLSLSTLNEKRGSRLSNVDKELSKLAKNKIDSYLLNNQVKMALEWTKVDPDRLNPYFLSSLAIRIVRLVGANFDGHLQAVLLDVDKQEKLIESSFETLLECNNKKDAEVFLSAFKGKDLAPLKEMFDKAFPNEDEEEQVVLPSPTKSDASRLSVSSTDSNIFDYDAL